MAQVRSKPPIFLDGTVFDTTADTRVYWLGGGSFLIVSRGDAILIDPQQAIEKDGEFYGENELRCFYQPPLDLHLAPEKALALYTHSDADHFGPKTALLLAETGVKMAGPAPVFEAAVKLDIPQKNLTLLRIGDVLEYGSIRITAFAADHPWQLLDLAKFGRPFERGDCLGYIIETPDAKLFFAGDTRLMPEHMTLSGIDLFGMDASTCAFHLAPMGSGALSNHLKEAMLVPCHYGTYDADGDPAHAGDPAEVLRFVKDWKDRYKEAAPGECIRFAKAK